MKRQILFALVIVYSLAGCGIHPSDEQACYPKGFCGKNGSVPNQPNPEKECPVILTESLPEATVYTDYLTKIDVKGKFLYFRLFAPGQEMHIDNKGNLTLIKPAHIYKKDVYVFVSNGSCSDNKKYSLIVNPYVDPATLKSYDYYMEIFPGNLRYLLVAETPAKQDFIDTEFAYYESVIKGENKALSRQFEINGTEMHPAYNKMRYHLTEDDTCYYNVAAGYIFGEDICMFPYERALEGSICINLSNPEERPTDVNFTCLYPYYWLDPSSLDDQTIIVHETQHAIQASVLSNYAVNQTYSSSLDEQLARSVSFYISGSWGYGSRTYIDSLCEIDASVTPSPQNYSFWSGFCVNSGFDFVDLPVLFKTARDIIECKKYPSNYSFRLTELKCSLDAAMNSNTYNYFCSQSWDCGYDPGSILGYVPDAYCGFIVQYMRDNNLCVP